VLIVRYRSQAANEPAVGVLIDAKIHELPGVQSLNVLWRMPADELRRVLDDCREESVSVKEIQLLAPVDGRTEVWAAGVTYEISREARVEESERAASVYEQVYDAPRPELFFKAASWRVVGDGANVGVREDSTVDVPEPELALVVNAHGAIVGYTVCDDVSSRSIEGENPLYLPQAKMFRGSCALGPGIRPAWEIDDPYSLEIAMSVDRGADTVWSGSTSTASLHRRFEDLVEYLLRGDVHPDGLVLSTGTSLVPPAPFSLTAGDVIRIAIDSIGTLTTGVTRGVA
jgi:2-dehydro-3-deoxy-D-arabinonate dehydratase